jgi:hypothetical protein
MPGGFRAVQLHCGARRWRSRRAQAWLAIMALLLPLVGILAAAVITAIAFKFFSQYGITSDTKTDDDLKALPSIWLRFAYRSIAWLVSILLLVSTSWLIVTLVVLIIDNQEAISAWIPNNALFSGVVAIIWGIMLYKLRSYHPFAYGILEVFVALLTLSFAVTAPNQSLLPRGIGIFSAIYIIVRGLDNIDKGLPLKFRKGWDRWFPKRATLIEKC